MKRALYRWRQQLARALIRRALRLLRLDCVEFDDATLTVVHMDPLTLTRWVGRVKIRVMINVEGNVLAAAVLDNIMGALLDDARNRRQRDAEEKESSGNRREADGGEA